MKIKKNNTELSLVCDKCGKPFSNGVAPPNEAIIFNFDSPKLFCIVCGTEPLDEKE